MIKMSGFRQTRYTNCVSICYCPLSTSYIDNRETLELLFVNLNELELFKTVLIRECSFQKCWGGTENGGQAHVEFM